MIIYGLQDTGIARDQYGHFLWPKMVVNKLIVLALHIRREERPKSALC